MNGEYSLYGDSKEKKVWIRQKNLMVAWGQGYQSRKSGN